MKAQGTNKHFVLQLLLQRSVIPQPHTTPRSREVNELEDGLAKTLWAGG